jgi:hypothetical protein
MLSPLVCWFCMGAPAWPADGTPNRDWVQQAIEWRVRYGLHDCQDVIPALDAMTLEWISESSELSIEINQDDWSFLLQSPELLSPLIQVEAMLLMQGHALEPKQIMQHIRRIGRKTNGISHRSLRQNCRTISRSSNEK